MSYRTFAAVRPRTAAVCLFLVAAVIGANALALRAEKSDPTPAADTWVEIVSPHFTVISNAGEGTARNVGWQFEQIRSGIQAGWPWARADLDRPFVVIAVKDEASMRSLAPQYWEGRNAIRPASVSVTSPDRQYVLVRTDVKVDGPEGVTPYQMAYWGYAQLTLSDSFDGRLPFWFGRGLTAVLSNTNITNSEVQFGRIIPWYVEETRTGRYPLAQLLTMDRSSPEYARETERRRIDAQLWVLMHYLVFGEADRALSNQRLNDLAQLSLSGMPADAAITKVFGSLAKLDEAYKAYLDRGMFRYSTMKVDARIQSKEFVARPIAAAEAASTRAAYLTATSRFADAHVALDEAKKAAPDLAAASVVEGLLADRENRPADAKAAYDKAVEQKTQNYYAYVRAANLIPRAGATPESLAAIQTLLTRASELNGKSSVVFQSLGGVLMQQNQTAAAVEHLRKAVALEPLQSSARMTLASALLRANQRDEALKEAQTALSLARNDAQRQAAQNLIDRIK